jgi:hypothetical protein
MQHDLHQRIDAIDWPAVEAGLRGLGHAHLSGLLTPGECTGLAGLFDDDDRFRSTVEMARHRFGEGRYRYFRRPLPDLVAVLRRDLYRRLAPIANRMQADMRQAERYPAQHDDYLKACHDAGQTRPTPLLLRYGAGGYNCLHQDLYGDLRFPLQAVLLLSRPGRDFAGGEFLLVEQRPRAQSIGHAIAPEQGDMVIFPVAERPVAGARGHYRVKVRHGVSRVHRGQRTTLGIIFHDAR